MTPSRGNAPSNVNEEALQIEKNLARFALSSGDRESAWERLKSVIGRLIVSPLTPERDMMLISATLELANVNFVLGKGFRELSDTLNHARDAAERTGDLRSRSLVNLHMGRLFYFAEQRALAVSHLQTGKAEAEDLGDEDILTQSSEFIGLYYFIQGRFQEAIVYFEMAAQSFESEKTGRIINPSGPLWLSYCAAFLGQFHRAIGTLDYYRRVAVEGGDKGLATTLRAALGIILISIGKNMEAHFHLSGALQEAIRTKNILAGYFAKGGLAFHHFSEGRLKDAWEWLLRTAEEVDSGIVRQYASPIVLETLFELHRNKINNPRYLNFPDEMDKIMREPNIHLKGVAFRLMAMEQKENGADATHVQSSLIQSETLLVRSGDPIQMGKTHVEMARMKLQANDVEGARHLAEKARKDFASYVDVFFPDDLRPLLSTPAEQGRFPETEDQLLGMFSDVIQELSPSADFDFLLSRTVKSTNRYFGAERGGIFWFGKNEGRKAPVLRGPCNLSQADVSSKDFRDNLALVFRAYHENLPQVFRRGEFGFNPTHVKAMICVPFEIDGQVRGVLYHDNAYVRDCFDHFSPTRLRHMARWLTSYINHIFTFSRRMEQKSQTRTEFVEPSDAASIITGSPAMIHVLNQADRIALSDSTVLIHGETGVGKELLARRIHKASGRNSNPLVIIDPTVIPENLVESELFGYEKGAFTGADRQKKGRMEMAHKGTLFIDEVGEIPKSIQVKLLRAIQEKTMTRIGGGQGICSDFRLIAATNRNLAEEVAEGRFREDLFYRLNVIPITLPPLRERSEDILLLAGHFLKRFAFRYNRPDLALSKDDETALSAYPWPGNIRELRNIMERAVLLAQDGRLHLNLSTENKARSVSPFDDFPTLDEIQRRYIQHVFEKTGGKIAGQGGAADILGIKRTSLYNRMAKLKMR